MKLQILFILLPALGFLACVHPTDKVPKQAQLPETVQLDSANFVIFPVKEAPYSPVRNCKPAELSSKDLEKIEVILLQQIRNYNLGKEADRKLFMIHIEDYKRQLIAGTNSKGELLVWVNCFCSRHFEDWKDRVIIVEDGGKCFFNLTINLSKESCEEFYVNGSA